MTATEVLERLVEGDYLVHKPMCDLITCGRLYLHRPWQQNEPDRCSCGLARLMEKRDD